MSMYQSVERLRKEFEEHFGNNISYRQMWFIVKVAKGVRSYCRSNAAFNNYFNGIFGKAARFEQVTKTKPNGEHYQGLEVTIMHGDAELKGVDVQDDEV